MAQKDLPYCRYNYCLLHNQIIIFYIFIFIFANIFFSKPSFSQECSKSQEYFNLYSSTFDISNIDDLQNLSTYGCEKAAHYLYRIHKELNQKELSQKYLYRAADLGHTWSQIMLARNYKNLTPRNDEEIISQKKSFYWYSKAFNNSKEAQYYIGLYLFEGLGVARDIDKAYEIAKEQFKKCNDDDAALALLLSRIYQHKNMHENSYYWATIHLNCAHYPSFSAYDVRDKASEGLYLFQEIIIYFYAYRDSWTDSFTYE